MQPRKRLKQRHVQSFMTNKNKKLKLLNGESQRVWLFVKVICKIILEFGVEIKQIAPACRRAKTKGKYSGYF